MTLEIEAGVSRAEKFYEKYGKPDSSLTSVPQNELAGDVADVVTSLQKQVDSLTRLVATLSRPHRHSVSPVYPFTGPQTRGPYPPRRR